MAYDYYPHINGKTKYTNAVSKYVYGPNSDTPYNRTSANPEGDKRITRTRIGTDRDGNPLWQYTINGKADTPDKPNPRGGSGSGSGRRSLNLKVYKRLKYNDAGVKKNAKTLSDAQLREAMAASRTGRMGTNTNYQNTMRQMELDRARGTAQNREALGTAQAQGANVALNRGMGYGSGYQNTRANVDLGYQKMLTDLYDQYAVQQANAAASRNAEMYGYDQNDYVARANQYAQYIEFLNSLDANAWNKYMGTEGLRKDEVQSENQRRSAL